MCRRPLYVLVSVFDLHKKIKSEISGGQDKNFTSLVQHKR